MATSPEMLCSLQDEVVERLSLLLVAATQLKWCAVQLLSSVHSGAIPSVVQEPSIQVRPSSSKQDLAAAAHSLTWQLLPLDGPMSDTADT